MQREVFVNPPPEKFKDGFVWKLKKPVYGLPDASRQWFLTIKSFLLELGLSQSRGDSCLFIYRKGSVLEGLILVHVDDFLAAGSNAFENDIMKMLLQRFCFGKVSAYNFT